MNNPQFLTAGSPGLDNRRSTIEKHASHLRLARLPEFKQFSSIGQRLFRLCLLILFAATGDVLLGVNGPQVSNDNGTWGDGYGDNIGISSATGVQVAGGSVSLSSANNSGEYTTVDIIPSSSYGWVQLKVTGTYGHLNDLQAEVIDADQNLVVIGAQPVNAPINLAVPSLNSPLVRAIRIRIIFNKSGIVSPSVDSVVATWQPKSQLLLDIRASSDVQAGENVICNIGYSVSFVTGKDLVIWYPLPSYEAGTLSYPPQSSPTPYALQNDNPIFVSATKGGVYTPSATVVSGVPIPARSVYWKPDPARGVTDRLGVTLASKNGALDSTVLKHRAYAAAANADPLQSVLTNTTIHSAPAPSLKKDPGGAIFNIHGQLQTGDGTLNSFTITAANDSGNGRETMYKVTVYDNVYSLLNVIDEQGTPGVRADDFLNISPPGGTFVGNFDPDGVNGPLPPVPAIVWTFDELAPGAAFVGSFSVKLRTNPVQTNYTNYACMISDQTSLICRQAQVQIGLDQTPSGLFALGDNASGSFSISAQTDDNKDSAVPYGSQVAFALKVDNAGVVKLNDLIFADMIPTNTTFRSAWLPPDLRASGARIFYSTFMPSPQSWDNPPPYTYTQAPADVDLPGNNYWEPYPPPNPGDVKWILYYFSQFDSSYFPNLGTPALPPNTPITSGIAYFDVDVFTPSDQCTDELLRDHAIFQTFGFTDLNGVKSAVPGGLSVTDDERLVAKGKVGRLRVVGQSSVTSPVELPSLNAVYSITIANDASPVSDTLANVQAVLQLSEIPVNGVLERPSVQSVSPLGSYDFETGEITVPLELLAPGASRTIQVSLGLKAGTADNTEFSVTAIVTGQNNQCGSSTVTDVASGRVRSSPKLRVDKFVRADLIPSGATNRYDLTAQNLGTGPSTGTIVVDSVPAHVAFLSAFGDQYVTEVLFSKTPNLPPHALTPFLPIDANIIANFSAGKPNDAGTPYDSSDDFYTSPFGRETRWIAWKLAAPGSLEFPINTLSTLGFFVQNDHDGPGPNTTGSPHGTQIYNEAGIFSSELPQAIGNQVITYISDDPSIVVGKRGPSVVEAGVSFDWIIDYHNDTLLTPDETAVITDILPPGVSFLSATHLWNDVAVANGAPGLDNVQPIVPGIVNNGDGSTTLTFVIAGPNGFRGNSDLTGLEGATITLKVVADSATPSETIDRNNVCGTATHVGETVTSCASHQVTVRRPDLSISKYVKPLEVLSGGTLTYQIVVANPGAITARGVSLTDMLPPGVSYAGGLSVSPGYTLDPPTTDGQKLTWSVANGNALTRTEGAAGEVPAKSGNIIIQFNALVASTVAPCTTLTNIAKVSTISAEEPFYPNVGSAIATVPPPNLAVAKSGPDLARPGNVVKWDITAANVSAQAATGVYLIDTLPHRGINSDVTFLSVIAPAGVTVYYHSGPIGGAPPSFDFNSPVSGNWSGVPGPQVNFIALRIGPMAGNATLAAHVNVELLDPNGGNPRLPDPGTSFTNTIAIFQADPLCEDATDNVDTAVVRTPALDMALTKTASSVGSIPGVIPGQPITYTIGFKNNGTVRAYGIRITDTISADLVRGNPTDNFTVLVLADANGNPVAPVNSAGSPITGAVPITRVMNGSTETIYFGTTTPTDALYYQNVGIPVGAQGTFEVYTTVSHNTPDSTSLCNTATVFADVGIEEVLANNTAQTCTVAWRADVTADKSGVELISNDPSFVEQDGLIRFKVCYDNKGHIGADDVRIVDTLPAGTTLVSVDPPPGASVNYFPDRANANSFEVNLGTLDAPANWVGLTPSSGDDQLGPPPQLQIERIDTCCPAPAVQVTWEASAAGFKLQVNPRVEDPQGWSDVPNTPTAFPGNRLGVLLPLSTSNSMPACFFRMKSSGQQCAPGIYHPASQPVGLLNWNTLYVNDLQGSNILYSVGRVDGTNVLFDLGSSYTSVSVPSTGLDLSGISPAYSNLVLRAEFTPGGTNDGPCLKGYRMTYEGSSSPCFTYLVKVDGHGRALCGSFSLDNTVVISTSTPQIRTDNDTSTYHMDTRYTDLHADLNVNKAAALVNETLTYQITWTNRGPFPAPNAYILVALPDGGPDGVTELTLLSVTPGSGVTAYYNTASTLIPPAFDPNNVSINGWQGDSANANYIVFVLGSPGVNEGGIISYTARVKSNAGGQTLVSCLTSQMSRRKADCDDSSCATTVIGTLANLVVQQTGPDGCVHPGQLVIFTVNWFNNGNAPAANVVLTETLASGLTFDSAVPPLSGPGLTWNNLGATAGTIGVGESGTITLMARLDNDYSLVGKTLISVASIGTSASEANLSDNRADVQLPCITADLVRISGYVYHDRNNSGVREPGEVGIPNVTATLTGTDVFNNSVTFSTLTGNNGQYSFSGLNPGLYTLTETQPATWASTADTIGTVNATPRGNNSSPLDDVLGTIQLGPGDAGIEYNFGENYLGLGNLVWRDDNRNGIRDSGEPGLTGVTVELWSPGPNSAIGGGDDQLLDTTTTLGSGFYQFTHLLPANYFVRIPAANFSSGGPLANLALSSGSGILIDTAAAGPDDRNVGKQSAGAGSATFGPVVNLSLGEEAPAGIDGDDFNAMQTLDFGFHPQCSVTGCLQVTNEVVNCLSNRTYRYTFSVTNLLSSPINSLAFDNLPANVAVTPSSIAFNTPLNSGEGASLSVTIDVGNAASLNVCFDLTTANATQCCINSRCLDLPICCAVLADERLECATNGLSDLTYTFTVQNLTDIPVKYLSFIPLADCFSFTPEILRLPAALLPGQSTNVAVGIDQNVQCGSDLCFLVGLHNSNLVQCCSLERCLRNPSVPQIRCSSNVVAECDSPSGTVVNYTNTTGSLCSFALAVDCTPPSGSRFAVGSTTVNCQIANQPNGPACSFTVTVIDSIAPVINCSSNLFARADAGQCSKSNVTYSVSATDNCDGVIQVNCIPPSNSTFTKGTTTVNCSCADSHGHGKNCSFDVTITDGELPQLACPSDLTLCPDSGQTSRANVLFTTTATDNCPGVNVVCMPPSGSTFMAGTTPVSCTATDAAGNSTNCSFQVTIQSATSATALSDLTRCPGESAPFTTSAGGTGPFNYAWKVDGLSAGGNASSLTVDTSNLSVGNHQIEVIVTGACGSVTNRATLTLQSCPQQGGPCSFTQGFYGNAKGKFNGTPSLTLCANLLAQASVVVGKPGRSLSIVAGDATLLQQRMPAGGTATTLPASGNQTLQTAVLPLNSKGAFVNVLMGQTITLTLNTRLNPNLLSLNLTPSFCTQGVLPGPDALSGTPDDVLVASDVQMFTIPSSVLAALANTSLGINSVTVQGLIELANRGLAAQFTGGASLPDLTAATDAINRGFDQCRVLVDCATHTVIPDAFNDTFNTRPSLTPSSGGFSLLSARKQSGTNDSGLVNVSAKVSNISAHKEPGEPNHAGNPGGKSVWWDWTAPVSGPVTISTLGSSFDTLLAVYVGSSVSNLVGIASNDDTNGLASEVSFVAEAATNYLIAVDGYNGAAGNIVLTVVGVAPHIDAILLLSSNAVRIEIQGEVGRDYIIEASSDLTNWTPIAARTNVNGALEFIDADRTMIQRFYRVREVF